MMYVYILQSESDPKRFYEGITEDLKSRLKTHNAGAVFHTAKYKPWKIKTTLLSKIQQRRTHSSDT